jgi:predicted AAA+ superfamily ATPase
MILSTTFDRLAEPPTRRALRRSPAVALLGPRQVGKTTLARRIAAASPDALYLDLESSADRARLAQPRLFLERQRGRLVVLDEIQHVPDLFAELRGEIDADRRPGRFLMLGSASIALLRQSSESLAGRLQFVDMAPLVLPEVQRRFDDVQALWLRGGFPGSYTAAGDDDAWHWREAFMRNLLWRDLPALGIHAPPETLHRFWRMLAHLHGQLFNASSIAASLGVSHPTVTRHLDALCGALMVRRVEPYHANLGKRLVKSPKVYVRDSGLLHHLLGVRAVDDLIGHPAAGASWEGFVIEQICAALPAGAAVSFYRTAAGAELDLLVELGRRRVGFEIKFSTAPALTKGFWQACEDTAVERAYVVAPVREGWPMAANVEVVPPLAAANACTQLTIASD